MKKKGFTLVELLAVIVILAVIALITIPLIGNVIEDSRKKAFESSVQGLVEVANYYTIEHDGIYEFLFDEEKKGMTKKGEQLDYRGVIEADGKLYIDSNGDVSLCLMNEKYYAYKNYNSGIYVGEKKDNSCVIGYDAITNKYVAALDDGTGSISNVYSKEEVNLIVDDLQEQITSNKNKLDTIESVVNTNQTEITNIKEQLSNMQIDTDNLATKSQLEALSSIVNNNMLKINEFQNSSSTAQLVEGTISSSWSWIRAIRNGNIIVVVGSLHYSYTTANTTYVIPGTLEISKLLNSDEEILSLESTLQGITMTGDSTQCLAIPNIIVRAVINESDEVTLYAVSSTAGMYVHKFAIIYPIVKKA